MKTMQLLDEYMAKKKEVLEYFGYVADWVEIPLEDYREYVWQLDTDEKGYGEVLYAETEEDMNDREAGEYYSASIYTQRFLNQWVYRGEDFTLICMDTHTDGNKFLGVFDNSKEIKGE